MQILAELAASRKLPKKISTTGGRHRPDADAAGSLFRKVLLGRPVAAMFGA